MALHTALSKKRLFVYFPHGNLYNIQRQESRNKRRITRGQHGSPKVSAECETGHRRCGGCGSGAHRAGLRRRRSRGCALDLHIIRGRLREVTVTVTFDGTSITGALPLNRRGMPQRTERRVNTAFIPQLGERNEPFTLEIRDRHCRERLHQ